MIIKELPFNIDYNQMEEIKSELYSSKDPPSGAKQNEGGF